MGRKIYFVIITLLSCAVFIAAAQLDEMRESYRKILDDSKDLDAKYFDTTVE